MSDNKQNVRQVGKDALASCLNIPKNVEIMEKVIFNYSEGDICKYNDLIFQTVGAITKGCKLSELKKDIMEGNIGWNDPVFDDYKFAQKEDDDFIENPFEVEEGALQCRACNSKRTISYSKQTRSADEPASTVATCINCKKTWVYSG